MMKRILGILGLLAAVVVVTAIWSPVFMKGGNIENVILRIALFSFIGIGVSFVIITKGIDLSIGSLMALTGVLLPMFLAVSYPYQVQWHSMADREWTEDEVFLAGEIDGIRPGDLLVMRDKDEHVYEMAVESTRKSQGDTAVRVRGLPDISAINPSLQVVRRYRVESVDAEKNLVVIDGDHSELGDEDRITYLSDSGEGVASYRHLSIAAARRDGPQTIVSVKEYPGELAAGEMIAPAPMSHMPVPLALALVMGIALALGLIHGLLVTRLDIQPFVVTLCGLLIYRGMAQYVTGDRMKGFGNSFKDLRYLAEGSPFSVPLPTPAFRWCSEHLHNALANLFGYSGSDVQADPSQLEWVGVPMPLVLLVIVVVCAIVLLDYSTFGRYLLALGRNEEAARFSGIRTDRIIISTYVICSGLAGLTGILFALRQNNVQPASHANWYELYAIAAAVLGGCSLRGGEGTILGVLIGTALMNVLNNSIVLVGIDQSLEKVVIGGVILIGVVADELFKRFAARRRARREAQRADQTA